MGLRTLAERDLEYILEDDTFGFGWSLTLTAPNGMSVALVGQSTDISQVINPDTGQAVSGRMASICLRTSSIYSAGLELPVGISDDTSRPWVVTFDDINSFSHVFKVSKSNPDRALGTITLLLELYE